MAFRALMRQIRCLLIQVCHPQPINPNNSQTAKHIWRNVAHGIHILRFSIPPSQHISPINALKVSIITSQSHTPSRNWYVSYSPRRMPGGGPYRFAARLSLYIPQAPAPTSALICPSQIVVFSGSPVIFGLGINY